MDYKDCKWLLYFYTIVCDNINDTDYNSNYGIDNGKYYECYNDFSMRLKLDCRLSLIETFFSVSSSEPNSFS